MPFHLLLCFLTDRLLHWKEDAPDDYPDNLRTRELNVSYQLRTTRYHVMHHICGCPIIWSSRLQTKIALSTAEAKYIALSTASRQVIPLMNILAEISCVVFDKIYMPKPDIHCKVFEDNCSAIVMAESSKFSPRTKHITLKYIIIS